MKSQEQTQAVLPYAPILDLAPRRVAWELAAKRGRETIFYPFDRIKLREGFNTRIIYNGIEELAESIKAQGLVTPLTVDILKNGDALVEIGNRRYRALQLLKKQGWLKKAEAQGIFQGAVEVFRNDGEVTELDRIKRILSSNHAEPLTAYEVADTIERLKNFFNLSTKEISAMVGYSRQQVENMLILAKAPLEVKQAVAEGVLKPTTAIAIERTDLSDESKVEMVTKAKSEGKVIKLKDIPEEVRGEVAEKLPQENADFSDKPDMQTGSLEWKEGTDGEVVFKPDENGSITIASYDETAEKKSHTTNPKPPAQKSQEAHDKTLNTMKDEEIFCSETIQMLDKMQTIADKIPGQHGQDLARLIPGCIQRVQSVRDYVKNVRD